MSFQEVANMISTLNIPFAYRAFEQGTAQQCPFICYLYTGNTPEPADNTNYAKIETLAIELYTDQKDFELESQIETLLTNNELVFDREESWLSDEKMQMTVYTMDVLITETISTEVQNNG